MLGYVKTFTVLPSTIWGIASNEFTEKGLQNPISQQIPGLIKFSLHRKKTVLVGTGENIWNHVEIGESEAVFLSSVLIISHLTNHLVRDSCRFLLHSFRRYRLWQKPI